MKYRYNFYDILSLESNIDLSDIVLPLEAVKDESDKKGEYDLTVRLIDFKKKSIKEYQQIGLGLYYSKEKNSIVSVVNICGLACYWEISNLSGNQTVLQFNHNYFFLFKHVFLFPLSSIYQFNILIKMIMQLKLLSKNYTFLIGGVAALSDKGVVFTGVPGTGKTTTTLNFLNYFSNAKYISDDAFILGNGKLHSFPSPIRIRKFNSNLRFFKKFIDPRQRYKERLQSVFRGTYDIYFLEKSNTQYIKKISTDEGINKICSINNRVFPYFSERILASFSYIDSGVSFMNMQKKQIDILKENLNNSNFYILCSCNAANYDTLLESQYKT